MKRGVVQCALVSLGPTVRISKTAPDLIGQRDQKVRACVQAKYSQQRGSYTRPHSHFQNYSALHVKPSQAADQKRHVELALP